MADASPPKFTAPSRPLRWLPEFLELSRNRLRPQARLLGLSLVVGLVAGVGAIVFFSACQLVFHYALDLLAGYRPDAPAGEPPMFSVGDTPLRPWLLVVVPTVGGLLSGLLVYTLAPEAEGHGTDNAIDAYHNRQGQIKPRVPLVKIVASALTIGTGGSGGREGPIAQIGAGCGSVLGDMLRLRPSSRRVLLAAGMGAGIAAIFRAPLAGALFASEVLYRSPDFESEVIIPAALGSVIAYCTFGAVFGWSPLFIIPPNVLEHLTFDNPLHLIPYTALAIFLAVLAMIYTRSFYGLTYLFRQLPLPPHVRPAIGACLTGLLGVGLFYLFGQKNEVLCVLSSGYGVLQDSMLMERDQYTLGLAALLMAVAMGKIATTGLTIGSGGSGGVFGPSMVIGGCGGGALGIFFHWIWPDLAVHPANFVLIGMAGFFAAAAKTPFSTLVMVGEITGNYNLLLPTLWVCALAFLLSDEQSIYSSQVDSHARSPAHQAEFVRGMLSGLTVGQFMQPSQLLVVLHPWDSLERIFQAFAEGSHAAIPVVDEHGVLQGVVRLEEAYLASRIADPGGSEDPGAIRNSGTLAADLMRGDVTPLTAADSLDRALELFVDNDLPELPVVDPSNQRVIAMVERRAISRVYLKNVQGSVAGRTA